MAEEAGAASDHGPTKHVVVLRRARPFVQFLRVGSDAVRWHGEDANYEVHFTPWPFHESPDRWKGENREIGVIDIAKG